MPGTGNCTPGNSTWVYTSGSGDVRGEMSDIVEMSDVRGEMSDVKGMMSDVRGEQRDTKEERVARRCYQIALSHLLPSRKRGWIVVRVRKKVW